MLKLVIFCPKTSFLIDKQSQVDIMATLRSDFCITRGEGLFAHTKYCDLYIHCTAQAVAITMECARKLLTTGRSRLGKVRFTEMSFYHH